MADEWQTSDAVRVASPLLIGLVGPSGSGKTWSALRLATGIQKVTGGDIHLLDTEARRALHYADRFKFKHTPFPAPFGPSRYLSALEHLVKRGAKIVIVDSASHEHEGPGGVLEMHTEETTRLAKLWKASEEAVQMTAWAKPKAERRRLLNTILQLPASFIFCFRAKEKMKIRKGEKPLQLGWMPIAGEEFIFEMTINCLLYPKSDGVPTWDPQMPGEREMIKLPGQFRDLFRDDPQLSEELGERMMRWAEGGAAPTAPPLVNFDTLSKRITDAENDEQLEALGNAMKEAIDRRLITPAETKELRALFGKIREAFRNV